MIVQHCRALDVTESLTFNRSFLCDMTFKLIKSSNKTKEEMAWSLVPGLEELSTERDEFKYEGVMTYEEPYTTERCLGHSCS